MNKTRPRRPQTNGKVERFGRILLDQWACIGPWHSEQQRHTAYDGFIHILQSHRSHGAPDWATPMDTLDQLTGDNLSQGHT